MSEDFEKSAASDRVSVKFVVDNSPYNAGENAVFTHAVAASLLQRGVAVKNKHDVKDDSNIMGLIRGDNDDLNKGSKGPSQADIDAMVDRKVEEKLKPILDELRKADKSPMDGPKSPLAPAVKK